MNRCIIIREVIGHRHDLPLDRLFIRALFGHYKAFSCMHLARRKFGSFPAPDRFQSALYRNRVLSRVLHALDTADRVGVALAYAFAPESIISSIRKDRLSIYPA